MACISSLPTELMRGIIHTYMISFHEDDSMVNIDKARTNLRAVCSLWDAIITSYPELWRKFNFNYLPPKEALSVSSSEARSTPVCPPIDIVELWLERSREQPLEVTLRFPRQMQSRFPLLTLLASHISSWGKFTLALDCTIASRVFGLPLNQASRLQELTIEALDRVAFSASMHRALEGLPALRRLSLTGFCSWGELPTLFPLHHLSRLDVAPTTRAKSDDILSVMRHCTSAIEMVITTGISDTTALGPTVSLSNLQVLDLLIENPIIGAFEKMILPNLRIFRLKYWPLRSVLGAERAMLDDLRHYFISATHALEILRVEDLSYYSSGQLGTFLCDSDVMAKTVDIPIVQVCAAFEESSDRLAYDALVQASMCDQVRQRFKLRTWTTQRNRQTARMGWADYETYRVYEDFFTKWSPFTIEALFSRQ